MMNVSPALAYWNQRNYLNRNKERFIKFGNIVNRKSDFTVAQAAQIASLTIEFKPDLILELGRGKGNSTCYFNEVANILGGKDCCKVVSLCITDDFEMETIPQLKKSGIVSESWFEPLEILKQNILTYEYENLLNKYERVLVFWDAHGYDIAECVLGKILPLIQNQPHYIIMHDISDQRYLYKESISYNGQSLWKGNDFQKRIVLGNINSAVEQSVSIAEFITRNNIELISFEHSYYTEIGNDTYKDNELKELLGSDLYSNMGHWRCFSLNGYKAPFTFPSFNGEYYMSLVKNEDERIDSITNSIFNNKLKIEFIFELVNLKNANVIIFGASESGKLVYRCIEQVNERFNTNIFVANIIDNDSSKWGNKFCGLKVEKPYLKSIKPSDKVVIASSAFEVIRTQLLEAGVKEEMIMKPLNL